MATGVTGMYGVLVPRLVVKEARSENVNVTILLQCLVVTAVQEMIHKLKCVWI